MCISEMHVIFKSLGVASANGEVAELFCRNRFGGAAFDMDFERGLVVDQVTSWMTDDVGQPRLHAAEQRASPARKQQSVATRVEAAPEGRIEAKRHVLVANQHERGACCGRCGHGWQGADGWRGTSVVDLLRLFGSKD